MKRTAQGLLFCMLVVALDASAQTVDLADGTGRQIVNGSVAGGRAGTWLDVGDVSGDISNKDLIVGSPDVAASRGEVRVLYGWVARTDTFTLDDFHVLLAGDNAGDRFGAATNAGFVTTQETQPFPTTPRDLIVGAPGASGGRGEVYLFAGPISGPSLTTANALIRIIGAPGDQLGTALESADLNNDGFREIIAGAPGNGRVYVIDYHSAPVATRDLTVPHASVLTITGTGIGHVLAAGDVTGDDIFDLAVGAPTVGAGAGAVYVVNGRATGPLPTALSLPAAANSTFSGLNVGDNAGSGLWIRDADGDRQWDLVATAVDGDGPSNARAEAGEAYIFFGGAGFPAVLTPNVTIYGAAAGHRLGYRVWMGGITRDEPDDIALLARGANGGFGEGYIVYGRTRGSFPSVIDLASTVDRRIVSDETQGAIERIVIFEVTSEGAEDIVLGVPSANAGAGRLYFSISPTLSAEAQGGATAGGGDLTVNIIVNPGQSWSTPIRLKNRTNVPVNWEISTNQPWLTVVPATGTSTASQDGLFFVVASAQGLASGTYAGLARVFNTNNHLAVSLGVTVNMRVAPPSREPGDFSGDGNFDLVWQHQATGAIALWRMLGTTMQSGDPFSPGQVMDTNWKIVGTGDFNGDGHPDLLWHHQTQGLLALWVMNGLNQVSATALTPDRVTDTNWRIAATGDFNGDGWRDIIWQHQTDGSISAWLMNGTRLVSGTLLTPNKVADTNWKIVGAGDFNNDRRTDLVWQNQSTGHLSVWFMDGTRLIEGVWVSPNQVVNTSWKIRGVADVNNDGKPDLIWQNTANGGLSVWFMNGIVMVSGTSFAPGMVADLNWKVVGPR